MGQHNFTIVCSLTAEHPAQTNSIELDSHLLLLPSAGTKPGLSQEAESASQHVGRSGLDIHEAEKASHRAQSRVLQTSKLSLITQANAKPDKALRLLL